MQFVGKLSMDKQFIKKWVVTRNGWPAVVLPEETESTAAVPMIGFAGAEDLSIKEVPWEDFFHVFDEQQFVFLYEEMNRDGTLSNAYRFV